MIRVVLALLALFAATPASAWSRYGHETVAGIAWAEVRPETRAAIRRLLAASRQLDTPTCPTATLARGSVWADCIRAMGPRFSYTAKWHYQNVSICRPFDLEPACADGNCVSAQITRNARLLADRTLPTRERLAALLFLVHFVGDLHQPLHAGDDDDRGGNDARATYGVVSRERLNLHGIWDNYVAERAISTPAADVAGLLAEAPADRAPLTAGTPEDWSREAWAAARDSAYSPARGGDPCRRDELSHVDDAAIGAAIPVVRRQVLAGGLRLGRLLDEALAPSRDETHARSGAERTSAVAAR